MKKILLCGALFHVLLVTAQRDKQDKLIIEKGTWNVGGNFSFRFTQFESNFQNEDSSRFFENESTGISVFPNLGYAVGNNFIVGLGLGYGFSKSENFTVNDQMVNNFTLSEATTYSIFPYVRGYFPVGSKLAIYAQGEVRFAKTNSEFSDQIINLGVDGNENESYFIGIRPGFTYFISKNFALETTLGSLGYERQKLERDGERVGDSDNFNFNLNSADLFFGLSYYF